ncbi:kinase-regulated stress-responsive transcription factor skn7, partial [Rhizopus stolonifer]
IKSNAKNKTEAVPDFIQKLFRMLENQAFQDVFCWSPSGNSFLVKDTNEFSKTILPKHFKHCNFASFVRQLNKYDFHKIRSHADENHKLYGDQIWEFEHSHFKRDRRDLLEEIKRKTPGKKKPSEEPLSCPPSPPLDNTQHLLEFTRQLQSQVDQLKQTQIELETTLTQLNTKEKLILTELSEFQKCLRTKDELIQECLLHKKQEETPMKIEPQWQSEPNAMTDLILQTPLVDTKDNLYLSPQVPYDKGKKKMVANWATPPRVLLVDDDSVYRDVSGRMLTMVGCSIDLAKDGLEALQKMSINKYDLILMDIVMPKMDGIATTRNIRRYDSVTPIVSMTSNYNHNDIMEYIGIGMNDILPKPFSKNTLYDILEKHCGHLKDDIPRPSIDNTPSTTPNNSPTTSNDYWSERKLAWSNKRQKHDLYHTPPY